MRRCGGSQTDQGEVWMVVVMWLPLRELSAPRVTLLHRPFVEVCSLSYLIVTVSDEEVETIGWTQSTLLLYVIVSLVISIDQSNWLDDKRSPLVCHQFDDKGPPSVCHRVFRETGSMTKLWQIPTFNMSSG